MSTTKRYTRKYKYNFKHNNINTTKCTGGPRGAAHEEVISEECSQLQGVLVEGAIHLLTPW